MQEVVRRRRILLLAAYLILLVGGWLAGREVFELARAEIRSDNGQAMFMMIVITTIVYIVASALPFVPGAEIGFALIFLFGGKIAFLVYASMLAALTLSFVAGKLVPPSVCAAILDFVGLHKARDLVRRLAPLTPEGKLDLLMERAPARVVPFLLRHRYLAIMALFNIPGNSLVGGGGGIAFTAGLSGLFTLPRYLAAVAIAISPLPIFFMLTM